MAVAMVAMEATVDMVAMVMVAVAHCAVEGTGLMASTEVSTEAQLSLLKMLLSISKTV